MKSFRQKEIIEILKQQKVINTIRLSKQFDVSIETIRRDLDQLEQMGILKKVYGGAELVEDSFTPLPSLSARQEINRDAKSAIAEQAIQHVPDNCIIALDAGTTITEFCRFLPMRRNLTVICSDIHSAELLLASGVDRVYMMGGFLTSAGTSNGEFTKDFFSNISEIHYFICSTDGVDLENGLTTNELGINELKRRYLTKAKTRILLADHSKFSQKGIYRVCGLSDIDLIITDSDTPKEIVREMECRGIRVIIADTNR